MGKISDIIQFLHDNNPGALQMASDKFYATGLSLDEIKKRSEQYAAGTPNEANVLLALIGSVPYNDKATNYTAGYKFYVRKGTENNLIPDTYIEVPKRAKSGLIYDLMTGTSGTSASTVDQAAEENNQQDSNKPTGLDWFNAAGSVFGNLAGAAANIISAIQGQGSNSGNILGGIPGAGGAPLIILPQQTTGTSSDKKTSTIMIVGIGLLILVVLIIVLALIFRKK